MAVNMLLPGGVISMTAAAADRLVKSGNGDAALLYLHLLQCGGLFDADRVRKTLGWTAEQVRLGHQALGDLGLADKDADLSPTATPPEPEGPPDYTAADIARELEGASPFPHLVRELERGLGKVLSSADLKILYTIYDYLALPAEVVLLLSNWCIEETERKYGPGRRPRMSQIKKEAFIWHRLGVDTSEAADAHIRTLSTLREREKSVLPLLGIAGRVPVEGERRYISSWVEMGFDDETIALAHERTVLKKGSLVWPYMNSILKSWHQKNLHTVEQVQEGDSAWKRAPQPGAVPGGGRPQSGPTQAQAQARFKEEVDWMDRFLAQTDGKEGN